MTQQQQQQKITQILDSFIASSKESQTIWALQDPATEDWVVCDSIEFEQADVMPLWSSQGLAQAYCVDDWKSFKPMAVKIEEFLEFWVYDLNDDGVLVGLDWAGDTGIEIEPIEVAKAMADVETE